MPSAQYVVRSGPHLWVSSLLHQRGILTSSRIWEEFQRDREVDPDMIRSKTFLKRKIIPNMEASGKIVPDRAPELPEYKSSGWRLVPNKAFKSIAPEVLAQIKPLPKINRKEYLDYLEQNGISFEQQDRNIE
mmetsp:Transcript_18004/g.15928  ORF Transcript_18004/g.15928 Transcript_18004/m.15928 type:complete len:132 (+) Transcript_18004:29-424(+)